MLSRSRKVAVKKKAAIIADAGAAARPLPLLLLLRFRHRASSLVALASASASASGRGDEDAALPPPHVILGVPASASASEARRAGRARALEVHPDVVSDGGNGGSDESELLELNEAYAAFLRLRGVRSRGAVGKEGSGEEEDDDDDDDEDDPFLPPLFSSSSDADDEEGGERRRATFLFVDPFSIPNFDPFRWRELQDLLKGEAESNLTPETAADAALALLSRAGVSRMPPRSGVALLTARQLAAVEAMIESSLDRMDFEGGALAVSEALVRARAANSGWRRRRRPPRK